MNLTDFKKKALLDPEIKEAFDELADEFELINVLLSMRLQSGMTQAEVAEKMGTRASNVSRLESGRTNPSIKTLISYAQACGFKLNLSFKPA